MIACRDCHHLLIPVLDDEGTKGRAQCLHPKARVEMADFLTGRPNIIQMSIESMRTIGDCGPDAKLFEPQEH